MHFTMITMAKPAASPFGGSHFLLGFFHLQRRAARLGEGQREEINSVYPGNCSCYCKWPRRAHYKMLCEAVSLEWLSRGASLAPGPGPPDSQRHRLNRGAKPTGEEGPRTTHLRTVSVKAQSPARGGGRPQEAQAPSTSLLPHSWWRRRACPQETQVLAKHGALLRA